MKSPFDVAKEITSGKRPWDDQVQAAWNTFMINRALSMNPDNIEIVDCVQRYFNIPTNNVYDIYCEFIPQDKRYYPYVKSDSGISKLLKLICENFGVSKKEARDYMNVLPEEYFNDLKEEKEFTVSKIKKSGNAGSKNGKTLK